LIAHLNINSLKSKYLEVQEILKRKLVDIFILSETKLDDSFNSNIFRYNGYKIDRRDRNKFGGGNSCLFT
jgi:exonuclease III